jgi:glutathione synthase/RimK-type ligase-like ATP-grasp enzyme
MDAKGLESRRLDGPLWLQTYLKHERELRVFIAGNSEFAVQLESFSSSIVDFRLLDSTNADAQIVVVPPELSVTARRLMKRLGLNYCVFDIIVDADGTFWFVDVNPLGTWDYLEKDFGLSLTDKIVNGALSL